MKGASFCPVGGARSPIAPKSIIFLDYSRTFETRYDLFYDTIHINAEGQKVLTEEIGKKIKDLSI